jgi:biotin operon repressor
VSSIKIKAKFLGATGASENEVTVSQAIIAGWTGRDPAAVQKHIKELEELGVKAPATTPIFYRVSASRLTTAEEIEATGTASSGEVEYVLLQSAGKMWVGVGSDHTDREVETYGVTVSKQMCDKPIAMTFWPFETCAPHWDKLMLRSYIPGNGNRVLYQEGAVAGMIAPMDLIKRYTGGNALAEGSLMFCGTFAAKGGIRSAPRFDYELEDPILGRKITGGYAINTLPVLG